MTRPGYVVAALAVILASGVVHGLWSNRWDSAEDLGRAAARLSRVPVRVGDWHGADLKVRESEREVMGAVGCMRRVYQRRAGEERWQRVWVTVVCGRPAHVAIHTPDVCLPSGGATMLAGPRRRSVRLPAPESPAECWEAEFSARVHDAEARVRTLWSWSTGAGWGAPQYPRWDYARQPILYKLYAVEELPAPGGVVEGGLAEEFLAAYLPALARALAEPAEGTESIEGVNQP